MPIDAAYLEAFRGDLFTLSAGEMFTRYVLADQCRGLVGIDHEALRRKIAEFFSVQPSSVVIVGSAKLGFTLLGKPAGEERNARPPFSPFSDDSDVDVAIISDTLFDYFWKRCFEFWHSSGYASAKAYWPRGQNFRDYLFRGWMRPDHLPAEGSFRYRNEWFDYFRKLTSNRAAGDYKVTAGVYREIYFLEAYQRIAIERCKAAIAP